MIIVMIFATYCFLCLCGYLTMKELYDNNVGRSLRGVKNPWLYYFLQFTWGLLPNILCALVTIILLLFGERPYRRGWNFYFKATSGGAISLGIFVIGGDSMGDYVECHEYGHSIQNIWFCPFAIGMMFIPSVVRCLWYAIMRFFGRPPKKDYYSIWFEAQASNSGLDYFRDN